jgi:tetrahydromethanopterin S-methyltransferase subunit B
MKYAKVEGHVNLVRDQSTKAILNTDMNEYNNYINLRESKKSDHEKITNIEREVNDIKNDLDEIKNLLRNLSNESK